MQKYGLEANNQNAIKEQRPCLICDDPKPTYAWTDYSGEGYCLRCGIPYQLKWGSDAQQAEGNYPYLNIFENAIPMFRRYYAETGLPAGMGMFMGYNEYPEVLEARRQFDAWWIEHKDEYPELQKKSEAANA